MAICSKIILMLITIAIAYSLGISGSFSGEGSCNSPQYLENGKSGTIYCLFNEDFFDVLWYNTTEYTTNDPILDYRGSLKTGIGYESGEFDAHTNGSLIINHVSLEHEHAFTVVYLQSEENEPVVIKVEVIVTVKPSVPFPVFDKCANFTNACYAVLNQHTVGCSVHDSKPVIPLRVIVRTVTGDKNITSDLTFTEEGMGYTSHAITTNAFKFSHILEFLVCKASTLPGILENDESFLLAQRGNYNLSPTVVTTRYVELRTKMELTCANASVGFIAWKKTDSLNNQAQELLLYSINIGQKFVDISAAEFSLGEDSSLILTGAEVKHTGNYICLFGDGVTDGMKIYEVVVFVNPTPAYPVIEGCNNEQNCVLTVEHTGILTCSLKGIRPKVSLEWGEIHTNNEDKIYFFNHHNSVKDNGNTFDITVTSTYRLKDDSLERLTVECKVTSPVAFPFHLSTKIDLLLMKGQATEEGDVLQTKPTFIWMILVILCLLVIVVVVGGVIIVKYMWKRWAKKKEGSSKEMIRMLADDDRLPGLKDQFLKQIKDKYKDWYEAVRPIPYIKDRLYCVERVFVEGGIKLLVLGGTGAKEIWNNLESYESVFSDPRVQSKRRIIEGEPGYGKSTVTLQFAYDWCNRVPNSPLADIEILILLRLRQLGGISSIYKAIKRFLLPKESHLSEGDVRHILMENKSVVIILDGFDAYPDKDDEASDVIKILSKQMLFEHDVLLTTRYSLLPKHYPASTKRVRLTGFDNNARRYYIRKAVVGDDDESVRRIEGHIEENPILGDLCQVPFLFVLFAHMIYENEQFRTLNSVTRLFRHTISCFHSHMRNKMDDDNVRKYKLFENDHRALDKLAFEAFNREKQRIVWEKDEMCQLVGREFYDQYLRMGILVEEEGFHIIDDPTTPITEHVLHKREVRFYHKLFCEWYAAHYLTDRLQKNPDLDLGELCRHLVPSDVQYLYRFACGLNLNCAGLIIKYLNKVAGGQNVAILCILEPDNAIENKNIRDTIRHICDEGVVISGYDSLLLQRSSMQLLHVAAEKNIRLKYVTLNDCLQSVYFPSSKNVGTSSSSGLSTPAIMTTSGLALSSNIPVEKLAISAFNREMTDEEFIDILQFGSMLSSLRHIRFGGSVPPKVFWNESLLLELKNRKIKVFWRMTMENPWYILNLDTGRWESELDKKEINAEKLHNMKVKFCEQVEAAPETFHKEEVSKMRERLRKQAVQRNYNVNT